MKATKVTNVMRDSSAVEVVLRVKLDAATMVFITALVFATLLVGLKLTGLGLTDVSWLMLTSPIWVTCCGFVITTIVAGVVATVKVLKARKASQKT